MISTWGCHNSEFISRERNKARRGRENQEPERKERVRGGGKRNPVREKERERLTAEEGSLKKVAREGGREREWSERAETTCGCGGSNPIMEGDKFSGHVGRQGTANGAVRAKEEEVQSLLTTGGVILDTLL
ncbi:hypothetical protein CHARACLAT_021692 [Characodon lateralis]|uniref:Uncharacterized protein n=1 Tax=Characodon lateralis TaxID=208331 RepID=A0ABU7EVM5_9TELE|nr:hypothetical protein [Characodon lateralis]